MADFEDRKQNQGGGSHPDWQKRQGQQNQNQQQGGRQKQPQTDRDWSRTRTGRSAPHSATRNS